MADFGFLILFVTALGGCVATQVLSKRQFGVQKKRDCDRMRRGAEYAYMEGVMDEQSDSVDIDAFRARMAAWLATTALRDDWGDEAAMPKPLRAAPELPIAKAEGRRASS